jgi:hypothetical protein
MAALMPPWASETTSLTPAQAAADELAQNAVQNVSVSEDQYPCRDGRHC